MVGRNTEQPSIALHSFAMRLVEIGIALSCMKLVKTMTASVVKTFLR